MGVIYVTLLAYESDVNLVHNKTEKFFFVLGLSSNVT